MELTIGERIKLLRKRGRFTQQDLADVLGVTQQQVPRYESGKSELSVAQIRIIAKFLGTTAGYLIDGEETESHWKEMYFRQIEKDNKELKNIEDVPHKA